MIESELRRGLAVGLRLLENLHGGDSVELTRGDIARFRVWVRNGSDLPMQRVAGLLNPTSCTRFPAVRFEIRDLQSGEQRDVAEIVVRVVSAPRSHDGYDWIAKATLVASSEIAPVVVREPSRPVGYVPQREVVPAVHRPSSIPISEV